ncbi:hypothetical protein L0244_39830 [bacterium]|nr:hypothetical protein [bacterium]
MVVSTISPHNDPGIKGGFNEITPEYEIANLRNALPNRLVERGTKESIRQLERAQGILQFDLSYYLAQAKINYLQNTWQPIKPHEFQELIRNKRTRWIQSGRQLLDAIIELLDQLNLDLQGRSGTIPAAIDLWNENKRGTGEKRKTIYTPKDENRLSDYVARFLKQKLESRGVFISRENQVRRGSFTDIYIETKPLLPNNVFGQSITAIIEVKGCWNRDLRKAMHDQLKDRYMVENSIYHGIYLVGWFMCNKWNQEGDNSRWRLSPKDFDELKNFVNEQASTLSVNNFEIRPYLLDVTH